MPIVLYIAQGLLVQRVRQKENLEMKKNENNEKTAPTFPKDGGTLFLFLFMNNYINTTTTTTTTTITTITNDDHNKYSKTEIDDGLALQYAYPL